MANFSVASILAQLDSCAADFTFPFLDNGYVYMGGTKLHLYRDDTQWIIIIEVIGFNYRSGGHNGICNCLYVFGNCLAYPPGTKEDNFLPLTEDFEEQPTFDEFQEVLNPISDFFYLKGVKTRIPHSQIEYNNYGIELEYDDAITVFEFLRLLVDKFPNQVFVDGKEIAARIPIDIPLILQLQEWHHPDCSNSELPSENETFQQLAKVLETGNIQFYKPTHKPNTHWSNWPEGGTL
jgi:hypothetical protein